MASDHGQAPPRTATVDIVGSAHAQMNARPVTPHPEAAAAERAVRDFVSRYQLADARGERRLQAIGCGW